MKNYPAALVCSTFFLLFCIVTTSHLMSQTVTPDAVNVEYAVVDSISLKLDIYLPRNTPKPFPVIVWVHGGGWRGGSKENTTAAFMAQRGYAVISINYRLSQQAIFPAQMYDCKAAIRWIRANASKYDFNPEKIGAWGSSAGGHLVALLGTAGDVDSLEGSVGEHLSYGSTVQAVCDWYGPSNLLTIGDYPSSIDHNSSTSPEALLIGGALKENPDRARKASPISYVTRNDPPFLIMHGTLDMSVPYHQSVELDSALREAGAEVNFRTLVGAGHGGGEFTTTVTKDEVAAFFDRILKGTTTFIESEEVRGFRLEQNYPNPFNPRTTFEFTLAKESYVSLIIFDLLGKKITTLVNAWMPAGVHSMGFEASSLTSGAYFYRLQANEFSQTKTFVLVK